MTPASAARTARYRIFAFASIALTLVACGGGQGREITRSSEPVWCPVGSPGTFDARTVLGKPERRAERAIKRNGCMMRVVARDGVMPALRLDLDLGRIDVTVVDDRVTAVKVGGSCSQLKAVLPICEGAQMAIQEPAPPRPGPTRP